MDGIERFREGFKSTIRTRRRTIFTAFLSTLFLSLMLFSTDVYWNLETLNQGRFIDALLNSSASIRMKGALNLPITFLYSLLAGIGISNAAIQLKSKNLRKESLSVLPGFVAAGCASCGVGLASLLGIGVATTLLPFQGLGIKILGIIIMIFAIYSLGDADTCTIPSS
jgi:hypothetical protein